MALTERELNLSRKTPPTQKTPPAQSKLPRLVSTPNSAPTTIKWSSTVADRVASAEKTTNENRKPKVQRVNAGVLSKPLPGDKPLPSRPIARLSNSLSPSKDSRSLIDAREPPLRIISTAGEKHDWPALTPQSANSTGTSASTDSAASKHAESSTPISPSRAARASLMAAATTLTDVIVGKSPTRGDVCLTSSQSSTSSHASANESGSPSRPARNASLNIKKTRDVVSCSNLEPGGHNVEGATIPERQACLHQRFSNGTILTPSIDSPHRYIAFEDFTSVRDASTTPADSRPHSPSPASFSRPRPGSRSSIDSKTIKTASRIPVPDTKKATVIDVKQNRLSGSTMSNGSSAPTFGSRRLASPEALQILENGKIRRQLKRTQPDSNVANFRTERTWTPDSGASIFTVETPSLSHSVDNSSDGTWAQNSPETLPIEHAGNYPDAPQVTEGCLVPPNELQGQHVSGKHGELHTSELDRRPPPTSAFTAPLQTIPSQAVLLTDDVYHPHQTRTELNRTLSCLEGNVTPENTDVDQQTLLHMFGHLKCALGDYKKTSTTLSQNAAAAEKYLAQNPSVGAEVINLEKTMEAEVATEKSEINEAKALSGSSCTGKRKQTMISKWSDSTPSDKHISPAAEGLASNEPLPSIESTQSTTAKDSSNDTATIDYPSLIPARTSTAPPQSSHVEHSDKAAKGPGISRRRSSPTLGKNQRAKKKPGSVRLAREAMPVSSPSFSRTPLSAQSKRTTRLPTPHTKALSSLENESRGRRPSAQKQEAHGEPPKPQRSRSRSRLMLDKINGLFSGKRDRKGEAVPPVPRIQDHNIIHHAPLNSHPAELPTERSPTRTPRLPKMPSLSPSTQTTLTFTTSPTTTQVDDTPTSDSFSDAQSVQSLSDHILKKAQREANPQRKERLLNFAKVLNDSLISAREAQISAETAQHAAKCAQMSYEMTQQSLAMLQRLAVSMTRNGNRRRN